MDTIFEKIPYCFSDKNEDYLVNWKLQQFSNENKLPRNLNKIDYINSITEFGKINPENGELVLKFVEECLKEGIKKIMLTKIQNLKHLENIDKNKWEELIKSKFEIEKSNYILSVNHHKKIKLYGYKIEEKDNEVVKVSLNFTTLLKEQKIKGGNYYTIIYPIFVDIYLKEKYIVGRAKSKSKIYEAVDLYIEDGIQKDWGKQVDYKKLLMECFEIIFKKLNIFSEDTFRNNDRFKRIIHKIVNECTETPREIKDKVISEEKNAKEFVECFFKRQSINPIKGENYKHALEDIKIFMEKYISINESNKSIFTKDRYAYPTQIGVTDSDFSSIEEVSINEEPLQCKNIFFDNKKITQKEKKCDNVVLMFKRDVKLYFTREVFPVIMGIKRGYLHIDLRSYVLEEDINNVLSRIIKNN